MPLPSNDIESELSYAYLHAVASRAGINCKIENRHGDNYGVDAIIDYFAPIPGTYRSDVSLRVQLKATKNKPVETDSHISYFVKGVSQYDRLRINLGEPYRILIVLFLPEDPHIWLDISSEDLVLKKSAYWVCLYGASSTTNDSGETI